MNDYSETFLYRLRFLFAGILIIANVALLSFLLTSEPRSVEAKESSSSARATAVSGSPNVVTNGMLALANELGRALDSTGYALGSGTRSAASVAIQGSRRVASSVQTGVTTVARGVGGGARAVGSAIGNGAVFVLSVPSNILGFVSNAPIINSFIRPAEHAEVPIIDPNSPELRAALAALPPTETATQPAAGRNSGPAWPIHGRVTASFGIPHWPYQHTHTGIDISDGQAPGVTPVMPFRPGRVIDTVHSNYGLGNHVVVDHGSGVTSVYAHLNSISVSEGQSVGMETTVGFEGTTGLSTGTHLHFEIRVHGKAADPRQFISGQP